MSRLDRLLAAYRSHISIPWQVGVAGTQRVIFAVYDKADELRLRARLDEFAQATEAAGHAWHRIDMTDAFPQWLASQEYREAYFETPEDLDGYPTGEITGFVESNQAALLASLADKATPDAVIALTGVGALFGLARVSTLVASIENAVLGRLLVFFPGEYRTDTHTYRLLDARDGWNYLALPLTADHP